jgi:uncharacterized Zn-binding protein involved in type VI secretion
MRTFKEYLTEKAEIDSSKLKHLQHIEDLHIDHGESGFEHATSELTRVKKHVESGKSDSSLSTKIDGSPSVIVGHHPETGKYFVASKSAFNKDPKINYTHADIERNHGHAPGLVEKLKAALVHGHKILPKHGVFQGDILHSGTDVKHGKSTATFKPNTIEYTAHGDEADKVKKSKFGVALHTEYHGKTLGDMKAAPIKDHSKFTQHDDVYSPSVAYKSSGKKMSEQDENKFNNHLAAAKESHSKINYSHIEPHKAHINTYINQTVRSGETPSHAGYVKHLEAIKTKAVDSVKTEKAKVAKADLHQSTINSAKGEHKDSITHALNVQQHLQAAKDLLVKHMDASHEGLEAKIGGKKVGPEGYVSNHAGKSSKLVNRAEFSRANFQR